MRKKVKLIEHLSIIFDTIIVSLLGLSGFCVKYFAIVCGKKAYDYFDLSKNRIKCAYSIQ